MICFYFGFKQTLSSIFKQNELGLKTSGRLNRILFVSYGVVYLFQVLAVLLTSFVVKQMATVLMDHGDVTVPLIAGMEVMN